VAACSAAGAFANVKDGSLAEFFHVNDADANLVEIPAEIPDRSRPSTAAT
jgi:hypothetical protein